MQAFSRVQGLGFRVSGLGFRAWGLGFRVSGLGLRAWGLGFRVWGLGVEGFQVWGPYPKKRYPFRKTSDALPPYTLGPNANSTSTKKTTTRPKEPLKIALSTSDIWGSSWLGRLASR